MILHLQGQHSASEPFLDVFRLRFPQGNIVMRFSREGGGISVITDNGEMLYKNIRLLSKVFDFSIVSIVVIHFLDFKKEAFLLKFIPPTVPIIWWMYGGDLYARLWERGYNLYAPQTLPFVRGEKRGILRSVIKGGIHFIRSNVDKKVLKRITGVIPCEHPDYDLACTLLGRKVDYVDVCPCGRNMPPYSYANGNDIRIGHSASLSSNHLYALDIIRGMDTGESKIVLPLSYTILSEKYRNTVVEEFKKEFGERVQSICEYQDLESYERGFLDFKIAIFPSWRQEALGNIYICFYLGIKVFLSNHNPCLLYFRNKGYSVYALEDIKGPEDLSPLTQEEKEQNRKVYNERRKERDLVVPMNLNRYFSKYV